MELSSDYFLLYHGLNNKENDTLILINDSKKFYSIISLVLCVNRINYTKYLNLNSFNDLVSNVYNNKVSNINELYSLQYSILKYLQNDKFINTHEILTSFLYLSKEKILSEDDYKKLVSLFEITADNTNIIDVAQESNVNNKETYEQCNFKIIGLINEIIQLSDNENIKKELIEIKKNLNNKEFSIGITGVMNAGKSTMLNALMKEEVLGSSVVPETANLTIIKHGKPNAKVFYWNRQEWEKIVQSTHTISSIKDFVNETKNNFENNFDDYIQENTLHEDVSIKDLSLYTSASTENKICNLIKYVELSYELDFLKDGITIVDTPGLDDPVIQREEITKEYLNRCDMMFHLMNVSQSATLKDVEFIIDALLYQNITQLLIVITRCDMVSKEQLAEVITYTKTSIKKQLALQNKENKLDYILKNINFIPISSKMALLHNGDGKQEAIDAGYSIEDTGIPNIQEYINHNLYGENSSKSQLLINSSKLALSKVIQKQVHALVYEVELLNLSKDDLIEREKEFNINKKLNENNLKMMSDDINIYKSDATQYSKNLNMFIQSQLKELQDIIKQRVYSEVKYSYEKTKQKSNSNTVKNIILTAIKDGMVDVVRDYKYKFISKTQYFKDNCNQKYKNIGFEILSKTNKIDNKFKSLFLNFSNDILINKVLSELKNSKINKMDDFFNNISTHIKNEFIIIDKNINTNINKLSQELISDFFDELSVPLNNFKEKLHNDEKILKNTILSYTKNEHDKVNISINIHNKIKKLKLIQKGLMI